MEIDGVLFTSRAPKIKIFNGSVIIIENSLGFVFSTEKGHQLPFCTKNCSLKKYSYLNAFGPDLLGNHVIDK